MGQKFTDNFNELQKNSITYKNMNNNLKKHYGRPKKNRKIFYLLKKIKKNSINFVRRY